MGNIYKGTIAGIEGNTARVLPSDAGAKPTAKIVIPWHLRGSTGNLAKGLLRNANKYGRTGQFSKALMTGYAAASLLTLKTTKASMWDGTVFVYKVRHDFVGNKSTVYFRDLLEGY